MAAHLGRGVARLRHLRIQGRNLRGRTAQRRLLLRGAGLALGWLGRRTARSAPAVLLIRPDHLGDVLLGSPAVALLAEAMPGTSLTDLVGPWGAEAARHGHRGVFVETLSFPGFTRAARPSLPAPYLLAVREASRLRARGYAAALLFRPDHWWGALLAALAGIPVRIGFDTPETRPLLTHRLTLDPAEHAAARSIRLAEAAARLLGGRPVRPPDRLQFSPTPPERDAAERLLASLGLRSAAFVMLHPSAGVPLKTWPPERWAHLCQKLQRQGASVLLSAGPGDDEFLDAITRPPREAWPTLRGQRLGVVAAVLARARLAIGPDNGIMHLASAMGTPTVRLYGPASPAVFGPWPPGPGQQVLLSHSLPCVPCGHLFQPPCGADRLPPCMRDLTVEDVLAHVGPLLAGRENPPHSQL